MHRSDLDRHADSMDDYKRQEIMANDSRMRPFRDNWKGKLGAWALILLVILIVILWRIAGQ
jgi:hypothetical protein